MAGPNGASARGADEHIQVKVGFKEGTCWRPAYQRNNKSKGQKNLRCFPNCCIGFGHQDGFCGQAVTMQFEYPTGALPVDHLVAAAEFAEADSRPHQSGALITLRSINKHGTSHERELTLIEGLRIEHAGREISELDDGTSQVFFEFNRNLKGWHYGFLGSKKTRDLFHVFRAYVLEKVDGVSRDGEDAYRVIACCQSPAWQMYCRRRKNHSTGMKQVEMQHRQLVDRARHARHQYIEPGKRLNVPAIYVPASFNPASANTTPSGGSPASIAVKDDMPRQGPAAVAAAAVSNARKKKHQARKRGAGRSESSKLSHDRDDYSSPLPPDLADDFMFQGSDGAVMSEDDFIPLLPGESQGDAFGDFATYGIMTQSVQDQLGGVAPPPPLPLVDPNSLGYIRRIDSLHQFDNCGADGSRHSDPCAGFTNLSLGRDQQEERRVHSSQPRRLAGGRPSAVSVSAGAVPSNFEGHQQQQQQQRRKRRPDNSPSGLYRQANQERLATDRRWDLAVKVLEQLDLPRPLRAHKFNFSGPQDKILHFAACVRELLVHLDQMRLYWQTPKVPPHVEDFITSSKSLSEIDHFCLHVITCHTFDHRVNEFVSKLNSTSVDPYLIVSFGLALFSDLLVAFLSDGERRNAIAKSEKVSMSDSTQAWRQASHAARAAQRSTAATKSASEPSAADSGTRRPSGMGSEPFRMSRTGSTRSLLNVLSPTGLSRAAHLGDLTATPRGGVSLDDLDWGIVESTPRNSMGSTSSESSGSAASLKGASKTSRPGSSSSSSGGVAAPPKALSAATLNLVGLTSGGSFILSPKQSFSSLKQFNSESRHFETEFATVPLSPPPLYSEIDSFIAQTGQDGFFLSPTHSSFRRRSSAASQQSQPQQGQQQRKQQANAK